jgi:hypothetical protein
MSAEAVRTAEWEQLYEALHQLMSKRAEYDVFGEKGGYWVVEDDYGSPQHKLYLFAPELLTNELVGRIQRLLDGKLNDWEVFVEPDLPLSNGQGPARAGGIRIKRTQVCEEWDMSRVGLLPEPLRSRVGHFHAT